jgi:hypothetical protein
MHELQDPANTVNQQVIESSEMLGKECIGCLRILEYGFFDRDSRYRDGRKDLCVRCQSAPRLTTQEHTVRVRESNNSSEAVKRQRWDHQDDYRCDEARLGRQMPSGVFIERLHKLIPSNRLYITEGRIIGDLAFFKLYNCPQPQLEGRDFEYLFYCPTGLIPEFSLYEFDTVRDIPIREKQRGWRTVLLRLIKSGLLTQEQCDKEFGVASGPASSVWYRRLYEYRNQAKAD